MWWLPPVLAMGCGVQTPGGPETTAGAKAEQGAAPVARTTSAVKLRPVPGTCMDKLLTIPYRRRVVRRVAEPAPMPCGLSPEEIDLWAPVTYNGLDGWVHKRYLKCGTDWHRGSGVTSGTGRFKVTTYFTAMDEQAFIDAGMCSKQIQPKGLERSYCYEFLCLFSGVAGQGTGLAADGRYISFVSNAPGGYWTTFRPPDRAYYSNCQNALFATLPGPIGAAGRMLTPHVSVAVHTCVIPLGATVTIHGEQKTTTHRADDTGGMVRGNHIDFYRGSYDEKRSSTQRNVLVEWQAAGAD